MSRELISSGAPWESIVGYSRAVKVGNHVFVSGTTSVDKEGNVVGKGDAYVQAQQIFKIITEALEAAGASVTDVVRTRMFITNVNDWEAVGKAHGEVFRDVRPASTLLEVSALINPDLLVEIEVDALIA